MQDNEVVYALDKGSVTVRCCADAAGLRISSSIQGMKRAPHWFSPMWEAQVRGATFFFKQGLGFGGPSGHVSLASAPRNHENNRLVNFARSYDSFMCAGLYGPEGGGALAAGALMHDRFLFRATCRNRAHRLGLVECTPYQEHYCLDCSFAAERIAVPAEGLRMPDILCAAGAHIEETLRALARELAAAGNARAPKTVQVHGDSWYEQYHGFNRSRLKEVLAGLALVSPELPFRNIMVDESWRKIGDWFDADPLEYPGGLAAAFADIRAAGRAWTYEREPGRMEEPIERESLSVALAGHSSRLLYVTPGRGSPEHSLTLAGGTEPSFTGEGPVWRSDRRSTEKPIGVTG